MALNKEIIGEIKKDFEISQTKIWQLPESTILERQTLGFLLEFTEKWIQKALQTQKSHILQIGEGMKRNHVSSCRKSRLKGRVYCDCGIDYYNDSIIHYQKNIEEV